MLDGDSVRLLSGSCYKCHNAFALAGRNLLLRYLPRALPWAGILLALQAVFAQKPSEQDEIILLCSV